MSSPVIAGRVSVIVLTLGMMIAPPVKGAGRLDPAYPSAGTPSGVVHAMSRSLDGVRYVVGDFTSFGTNQNILGVAGLNAQGAVTRPFTSTHPSLATVGTVMSVLASLSQQVWVGGDFTSIGLRERAGLACFETHGALDADRHPPWSDPEAVIESIIAVGDDLVVGGTFADSPLGLQAIAMLDADGNAIPSFKARIEDVEGASVRALLVWKQTNILVGGRFSSINGAPVTNLACLTLDGSLVPGLISSLAPDGEVAVLVPTRDGRVYLGGSFGSAGNDARFAGIARLMPDGQIDSAFVPHDALGPLDLGGGVQTVAVQNDDRVVVGGLFEVGTDPSFQNLARLNADGGLDAGFAEAANETGPDGLVNCIAVEPDNSLLIGGEFLNFDGITRPYLARLRGGNNILPSVRFRAPAPFTKIRFGEPIPVAIEASDPDGSIDRVELNDAATGASIAVMPQAPFETVVSNSWQGFLILQARAVDTRGGSSLSEELALIEDPSGYLQIQRAPSGFHLNLLGPVGSTYELQSRLDFGMDPWAPLSRVEINPTNGAPAWDFPFQGSPQRFFRAVPIE